MRILVDTNVLIRWSQADDPLHGACRDAVTHIATQGWDSCTCAQVLIEFWVVATRPVAVNGLGLSISEVSADLADMSLAFACIPEPPDVSDRWQALAFEHKVIGKQAHDARLVALMLSHGIAQILTLNPQDFARYPEITAITPSEILAQ